MYYKLIKDFPKHEIGELLFKHSDFYEWLEQPNYLLPKDIVEDSNDFFEKLNYNWVKGEDFYYINTYNEIVKHKFNPKAHLKLVHCNNCYKSEFEARDYIDSVNLIKNGCVVIDKNNINSLINIIEMGDK